ncbi:MAG: DUF2059 domain-containing protein [Bacteroidota bacterium]
MLLVVTALPVRSIAAQEPAADTLAASHEQAIRDLLEFTNARGQSEAAIDAMIDAINSTYPEVDGFETVMRTFLEKYMSWESLEDEYIQAYARAYTEEEIRAIAEFYASDVGQKSLRVLPALRSELMQIGVQRVQQNRAEMEALIQEHLTTSEKSTNGKD